MVLREAFIWDTNANRSQLDRNLHEDNTIGIIEYVQFLEGYIFFEKWILIHGSDFSHDVNLVHGTILDLKIVQECPTPAHRSCPCDSYKHIACLGNMKGCLRKGTFRVREKAFDSTKSRKQSL